MFWRMLGLDTMRIKVKSGSPITPNALYLVLAIKADGSRDVHGMWLSDNGGGIGRVYLMKSELEAAATF